MVLAEGLSQREVARKLGISRNTVAHYLEPGIEPGVRVEAAPGRTKPAQEAVKADVVRILEGSRVTRKQRLTAERVHELLVAKGVVAASVRTVRRVMAENRRKKAEVYIPLDYPPGDLAEVDFFEILAIVAGREQKAFLFVLRLMHSGRDFAWVYPWQDQAAFLDGHVRAFAHFGCVPKRILYDNLKAAVRAFVGCERILSTRFAALAAHYGFGCRFARPATGHDKGGVEARGKGIRLQHLTPVPRAHTLAKISQHLMGRIERRLDRPRRRGARTIRQLWDDEQPHMLAHPPRPHDAGILEDVLVDGQAQIRVRTARYSVHSTWAKQIVRVWIYADRIVAVHAGERVEHVRQPGNGKSIWYPHYLAELAKKPAAVEQVGDVLFAQLGGAFLRVWRLLVDKRGNQAAGRSVKPLLQAILDRGQDSVSATLERAFRSNTDPLLTLRPPETERATTTLPSRLASVRVESTSLQAYRSLGGVR